MKFMLDIPLKRPAHLVGYQDKIMVIGSCFTEHIGGRLKQLKFDVMQNPNGILFDPISVAASLTSYVESAPYKKEDLTYFNELWHSWQHHSAFSGTNESVVLERINERQQAGRRIFKNGKLVDNHPWVIICLQTGKRDFRCKLPSCTGAMV